MSGNVIPLRKVQLIGRTLSIPFAPEDIRDGVYYELVTAGELDLSRGGGLTSTVSRPPKAYRIY